MARRSSLEEIETVLPLEHRARNVSFGREGLLTRRARARSIDEIHRTLGTTQFVTHRGSVRTSFKPESLSLPSLGKLLQIDRRAEYSLLLFHKKSKFRKNVKRVVKSRPFHIFIAVLVILNAISLCFYNPSVFEDQKRANLLIAYVSIVFIMVYIVEAGMKIIAYGLIFDQKAYLKSAGNVMDAFIILFGFLYISLSSSPALVLHVSETFASLMALKLVRILVFFDKVKFILTALAKSVLPLFYLSITTLCVMVFFTLMGMELFSGALHGGCYANYTVPRGSLESFRVSDFPCYNTNEEGADSSIATGSHICPVNSSCSKWDTGPNVGITSFDNFGNGLLTVFQLITLEGWSGVFYLYESALGFQWVWVYFFFVIFLGSIFVLNLWLGVLTSVFQGVSERQEAQGNTRRLKEKLRMDKDLANYWDWMQRSVVLLAFSRDYRAALISELADDGICFEVNPVDSLPVPVRTELDTGSDTGSVGRRPALFFGSTWSSRLRQVDPDPDIIEEDEDEREWTPSSEGKGEQDSSRHRFQWIFKRSRRIVRRVVKSLAFYWFILIVLAINLILFMIVHFPSDPKLDEAIYTLNYIFTGVYIAEFFLKFYGLGPKKYFNFKFNIADFLFTLGNILDLLIFIHFEDITDRVDVSAVINAMRCFKLITVFKYTRYWIAMKEIIATVVQLFALIISLLALIGIFLFVFTILGLRLFGDLLSVTTFVSPNFDNIFSSFLLVFQLLTTEDWHNALYRSLVLWVETPTGHEPAGYLLSIYFVVAIILGGFILVSIFLAIAVEKLSEVRSLEEDSVEQTEKTHELRKTREERLHALKNTSEPQVHRRTLRRVLNFYSGAPSQRRKPMDQSQVSQWRQLSLPVERMLRRGTSLYQAPDSTKSPPGVHERSVSTPDTSVSPKLQNPLRLVKRRSAYLDEQKARLGAGPARGTSQTSSRTTESPASPASSFAKDSIFRFPDSATPDTHLRRKLSSPGTPATVMHRTSPLLPYERTQSFPGGSPASSSGGVLEETPKLETIEAGTVQPRSIGNEVERPTHLFALPLGEDVSQRLQGKESSLENIVPIQADEVTSRRQSQLDAAESHIKTKAKKIWAWVKDYFGTIQLDPKEELKEIPNHSAFFILSPDNGLREFCYKVVSSKTYQTITYTTIFLSSLLLMLEMPIIPNEDDESLLCLLQSTLVYADILFIAYLLVEMLFKMIVLGVFLHRGSYFRGFFNTIDFIVTVTSLIPLIVYYVSLNNGGNAQPCTAYSYDSDLLPFYISTLRVVRVLRPVRGIRISGLYLVVTGLLSSLKSISSIFFVTLLVLTISAVIGTQIFRGRFHYCTDPTMITEETCKGYFFTYPSADLSCPKVEERIWLNNGLNFDHVGNAILTLFVMLTAEGWQNVMYSGINSNLLEDGVPQGPSYNNSPWSSIYFLVYMVAMTFVLVNLFQGFVIVTFQEVGVKAFRETKLDRNQRNCLYYALTTRPIRRFVPKFEVHQKVLDFVSHPIFNFVVFVAIVINSLVLALQVFDDGHDKTLAIYWINFAFTVFFAVETILKICAYTPPIYFRKVANSLDCLFALGSVLEVVLQQFLQGSISDMFQYSHIASTFRVLRLLRFIPQVRLILWTLLKSLEIFPWVGVLLVVVIFSYAVVGMQIFGTIEPASIDGPERQQITQYNNFGNFPQALLVMIRVSTGENWQDVMLSCTDGQTCFNDTLTDGPCGSDFAYFFFPSFFFISSILILNLFVAVIIDNFDYIVRDRSILGAHQMGLLVKLWSIYDPEASGKLTPSEVMALLRRCNPPVGWGKLCPHTLAYKKMAKLNMSLIDGKVTFNATLFALVRTSLRIQCEGCSNCMHVCNRDLKEKLKTLFPTVPQQRLDEVLPVDTLQTVRREYAARLIQDIWRGLVLQRRKIIELFQGSRGRVLKAGLRRLPDAGPDLGKRTISDFELDLLSSPSDFHHEAVNVTLDDIPPSPETVPEDVGTTSELFLEPFHQARGRGSLLQTIREVPETVSPVSDDTDANEHEEPMDQNELEVQSELSYTSAYSSPMGSTASLNTGTNYVQLKETSV